MNKSCMQDFYRCVEGYEGRADALAEKCCKKLVNDLHYEARIQAVVYFYGTELGEKITKSQARTKLLTEEQYMRVKT